MVHLKVNFLHFTHPQSMLKKICRIGAKSSPFDFFLNSPHSPQPASVQLEHQSKFPWGVYNLQIDGMSRWPFYTGKPEKLWVWILCPLGCISLRFSAPRATRTNPGKTKNQHNTFFIRPYEEHFNIFAYKTLAPNGGWKCNTVRVLPSICNWSYFLPQGQLRKFFYKTVEKFLRNFHIHHRERCYKLSSRRKFNKTYKLWRKFQIRSCYF